MSAVLFMTLKAARSSGFDLLLKIAVLHFYIIIYRIPVKKYAKFIIK